MYLKYYFKINFALSMFGMQERLLPKFIPLKEHSNILNINMFKKMNLKILIKYYYRYPLGKQTLPNRDKESTTSLHSL